ncbi:C40 family peptidase [Methylonatrum kenyense]|uniref:C40 family peptidase n=1 Tax=Methylonatrum kenyense TaxID=455253 RepID=UPI0020C0B446|nr:C40 family peptidase [Methylonatrum kenyense]MCK8515683.1 C40 family peptidase [Methylonatrum kenyense]
MLLIIRSRTCFLIGCLALLLVGCASSPPAPVSDRQPERPRPPPADAPSLADQILQTAQNQRGVPYRFGGDRPERGFDCSGLVAFSHAQHGVRVPRTASAQARKASDVPVRELRRGDLVFFRVNGRKVDHVGIYAGGGRFLHAPSSGGEVSYAELRNPYWRQRFSGAGRFVAME